MSTIDDIKVLKEQFSKSLNDKQNQLVADVTVANKSLKAAKLNLKETRAVAKTAKETAKAAKVQVDEAKSALSGTQAKLDKSYSSTQTALKDKLASAQRTLMQSRMSK